MIHTYRYLVLGITHGGCVDRLAGLRGNDPDEICRRALEVNQTRCGAYNQLVLVSIGQDGNIGEPLNIRLHRIETVPTPTYTLQPVMAYLGK